MSHVTIGAVKHQVLSDFECTVIIIEDIVPEMMLVYVLPCFSVTQ